MPPKRTQKQAAKPKSKGKAKAKPQSKRQAKAQPRPPPAPENPAKPSAPVASPTAHPRRVDSRRRLGRRDSDEVANRAVVHRLGHLPSSAWEGLRNLQGLSIRDVVKTELGQKKDKKGRLSTKFWVRVFDEFHLTESLADQLGDPPQGEVVDQNLLEAIATLHAENPVQRRTAPLERLLDYCDEMNRTSLYGLLRAVMESPTLPRGSAMKCQLAVLRYAVRTNVAEKHSDYWQVMKPTFDIALQWAWEDLSGRGVSQTAFLSGHGRLLAMFAEQSDLDAISKAGEDVEGVAASVKRVVDSSATGKSIFKGAWLTASRALFKQEVMERLRALEHLDFEESETESFKALMVAGASALQRIGHKIYKRSETTLSFMGRQVIVTLEGVNDEWEFRFAARVRTLALNSGALEPLPWEKVLFPPGSLEGERSFAKIPEALLRDAKAARSAAMQFLQEKQAVTLHQMMTVLNAKADALRALDRTIECELSLLNYGTESLVHDKLREQVLQCFPSTEKSMTIPESTKALSDLKLTELFRIAGPRAHGEVEGVANMLGDLGMGIPPTDKQINSFSDFFQSSSPAMRELFLLRSAPRDQRCRFDWDPVGSEAWPRGIVGAVQEDRGGPQEGVHLVFRRLAALEDLLVGVG